MPSPSTCAKSQYSLAALDTPGSFAAAVMTAGSNFAGPSCAAVTGDDQVDRHLGGGLRVTGSASPR